ncbi:MAG: thermonuclease family protein [Planctomycetes bacterium]|nr:thermonuclease family protein [Planctomycetota bacterium]
MNQIFKAALIVLFSASAASAMIVCEDGKVISVEDGATFTILTPNNRLYQVQLYAVEAPRRGQSFARESRDVLSRMILLKNVRVWVRDEFPGCRLVGHVSVDGVGLNKEMVASGWAWYAFGDVAKNPENSSILEAQQSAIRQNRGLWLAISEKPSLPAK